MPRTAVALALIVSAAVLPGCSRSVAAMSRVDGDPLHAAPPAPPPAAVAGRDPNVKPDWHRVAVSPDGRFLAYQQTVFIPIPRDNVGPLFLWDRLTGDLVKVGDDSEPGTRPAVSSNGEVVVYAQERDAPTSKDGVNPDPDVHRIVRWTRTAGPIPLTPFDYEDVPDLAVSDDGEVVAFTATEKGGPKHGTFLIRSDGGVVRVSDPAYDRSATGATWASDENLVALSFDGRTLAFALWYGDQHSVFIRDTATGSQRSLRDILAGVEEADEPALSADGRRLAARVSGGRWKKDAVVVVDLATGALLARSEPGLHADAVTSSGSRPRLSRTGSLLAYVAQGKPDGRDIHENPMTKPDIVIVKQVGGDRAQFVDDDSEPIDFLSDDRLLVGDDLYRFSP